MPDDAILAKAELRQLKPDLSDEDPDPDAKRRALKVQFNPDSLKVSYQNQIQQPEGAGDQRGSQAQLFVGAGTTKLTCTLWFDVNAEQPEQADPALRNVDDVRKLTNRVSYFITPIPDKRDKKKFVPPAVRFLWGSFQFDGIMDAVEETIEFFSPEGKPLRASVGISLTQQKIQVFPPKPTAGAKRGPVGTRPTTPVPQRTPVQKLAGENWQGTAEDNQIENPRLPPTGQRLELNRS